MASKKASFCTSVPDFQGVGTSASLNSSFPHMCLSPHNHAFLQQVEIQNTMRILWLKKKKQKKHKHRAPEPYKNLRGPNLIAGRSHSSLAYYL